MAATDFVTESGLDALSAAIATAVNADRSRLSSAETAIGTVGNLNTTATDLTAAVNEVKVTADAAAGGGVSINDGATNATQAWSSNKIASEISSSATDTLSKTLRIDTSQGLNSTQQAQGRSNLAVVESTADFAAAFNAAL